jgi:hypothetical protein
VIRLSAPEQMAEAFVHLRQLGVNSHEPLFRAAMREELRFAFILPDTRFPKLLLAGDRLPLPLVLADDNAGPCGPRRFPQARRFLRWARSILLHAAGGRPVHYAAVAAVTVLRGRVVAVETGSGAREAEWLSFIEAAAPRTPRLHIMPPPGGAHPSWDVPAGETVQ